MLFFLAAGSICASSSQGRTIIHVDIDNDGRRESVVLDSRRDPSLSVWRGTRSVWSGIPARWRPWKVQVADADGDGRLDIAVGVEKGTRFFPKPHNCLFIYGWDGREAYPKWLGSSLSRPFTDFLFIKPSGAGAWPLMAAEVDQNSTSSIGLYYWNGFGFSVENRYTDASSIPLLASLNDHSRIADP